MLLTAYFGSPGAYFAADWRGATHQIMASLSGFLQGQTQINAPLPAGGLRPTAAAGRGLQPELRIHTSAGVVYRPRHLDEPQVFRNFFQLHFFFFFF